MQPRLDRRGQIKPAVHLCWYVAQAFRPARDPIGRAEALRYMRAQMVNKVSAGISQVSQFWPAASKPKAKAGLVVSSAHHLSALTPGTRLGPYEILAAIGAGGMGEVYRARDTRLGRDVAVKIVPPAVAANADALARFERETRAVAALSHPNILTIHDVGRSDGTAYAVLELLEGQTLRARLDGGALPQRKALEIAAQMARGLAAAHDKQIAHRDLKPENIFVTADGSVKILDFGLARQTGAPLSSAADSATMAPSTEPGMVLGTVGYMAPEQVRGEPSDHRADIFALGCVLYEMLTGRRPFQRDTGAETMTAILKEDPPDPDKAGVVVAPGVLRTMRRCLEKRPEERFQSARDLAFALESAMEISSASGGRASERRT